MKTYLVVWEIDIEANSPHEAARKAREIQLDPQSTATSFDVYKPECVDLADDPVLSRLKARGYTEEDLEASNPYNQGTNP